MNLTPTGASFTLDESGRPYSISSLILPESSLSFAIETSYIAKTLQHLEVGGTVHYKGSAVSRLTSGTGTPIRDIFPLLHTLILPTAYNNIFPWTSFESLPSTLTRLGARLDLGLQQLARNLDICETLNSSYARTDYFYLDARPGAPAMIRHLQVQTDSDLHLLEFMPHFPQLETLIAPRAYPMSGTTQLPKNLRSIEVGRISSSAALLPQSLKLIKSEVFSIKPLNQDDFEAATNSSIGALEPSLKLSHLVKLSMRNSRISHEILSVLPDTVEYIDGAVADQDVLEALTHKINVRKEMPLLSTLILRITHKDLIDRPQLIRIGTHTIPSSVKTLSVAGPYELAPLQPSDSLRHHHKITSLSLQGYDVAEVVLPQLPPQLLRLKCVISKRADLNDPKMIKLLLNLPRCLRELNITLALPPPYYVGSMEYAWFIPVERGSLDLLPRSSLVSGAELHLIITRMLPHQFVAESLLFLVSECFVNSCLPRTLSVLSAPVRLRQDTLSATAALTASQKIFELFWVSPNLREFISTFLQQTLIYKLPLFGLFVPLQYKVTRDHDLALFAHRTSHQTFRLRSLPPNLSSFSTNGNTDLQDAYFGRYDSALLADRLSKTPPIVQINVDRWLRRTCFNVLNALIWMHLRRVLPIQLASNPIMWCFCWVNVIGSAIAVPALTWTHFKTIGQADILGNIRRQKRRAFYKNLLMSIGAVAVVAGFAWASNFSLAIAFGVRAPAWTPLGRIGSTIFACVGETILGLIASAFFF